MSPLGQHTAAEPLVESERDRFFRILLHDDRDSFYVVSSDASGVWTDAAYKRQTLGAVHFDTRHNYYVTHNGFTGCSRATDSTRQINALFFDLDCHGVSRGQSDSLIFEATSRIMTAAAEGTLPNPNLLVDSGRGLHLYYVLEQSIPYRYQGGSRCINLKGINYFKRVQEMLGQLLGQLLKDLDGISVDRAVYDHARVSRIPGTFNPKAGRFATLISAHDSYYNLPDLAQYARAAASRAPMDVHPTPNAQAHATVLNFQPMLMSRLSKVHQLQEHRNFDCRGSRELMGFVLYNTAVQIYDRDQAKSQLHAFNARFKSPLSKREIAGIERAVDTVTNVKGQTGHYILGADTVVRLLDLSEQEMIALSFFSSKRAAQRIQAKRETRQRRSDRNLQIVRLHKTGSYTQQQIASMTKCSVRTVHSVLKEAGRTKAQSTITQASRQTEGHVRQASPLKARTHCQGQSYLGAFLTSKDTLIRSLPLYSTAVGAIKTPAYESDASQGRPQTGHARTCNFLSNGLCSAPAPGALLGLLALPGELFLGRCCLSFSGSLESASFCCLVSAVKGVSFLHVLSSLVLETPSGLRISTRGSVLSP